MRKFSMLFYVSCFLFATNTLHAQCPFSMTVRAFPDKICAGESTTLVALGAQDYSWEPITDLPFSQVTTARPATTTTYTVTGKTNGCSSTSSITVVVNPLPTAAISGSAEVCLNSANTFITFSGQGGQSPYTFGYNLDSLERSVNGVFRAGPTQAIITTNNGNTAKLSVPTNDAKYKELRYHLTSVRDANNCFQNQAGIANVRINTFPRNPAFKSNNGAIFQEVLNVCAGSENIDFSVDSPESGASYLWEVATGQNNNLTDVTIKNPERPNTVISFLKASSGRIRVSATNTGTNCTSSVSQIVNVSSKAGFEERKIFLKDTGNLLIYPDNSIDKYKWGYNDKITNSAYIMHGPPVGISTQLNQFFIPGEKFTRDTLNRVVLDTNRYMYWVFLEDDGCESRVYYNGPGTYMKISQEVSINQPVGLLVFPNPNQGSFDVGLKGNIYGSIQAKIYNATGQQVFSKKFMKTIPEIYEKFNTHQLSSGLYFLELYSSDLKKVVTRFIIQH